MSINGKRAYELLDKIGFIRTSGSAEEKKASEILMDEIRSLGVEAKREAFEVEDAIVHHATLTVLEPYEKSYEVTAWKCCPNAKLDGEIYYAQDAITPVDLANMKGKIVLVNNYLRLPTYKKMLESGAIAFITYQGSLLDKREDSDLDTRKLRANFRKYGELPGVNMLVEDAFELVVKKATKAHLEIEQEKVTLTSHNVYATIPGTEQPDTIITLGAHYDSVPFSTGVYDNGAGSVIIMEILREFVANPPRRTLQFCWFGSEEVGLEGSKAYIAKHQDEVDKTRLMINVDVAGAPLGKDVAMITGPESLVSYINYLACEKNFSLQARQDIYSSDSTPFANAGVPAVSFCRFGTPGAAFIHCRHDIIKYLSPDALAYTAEFVNTFTAQIVNTAVFPVEKEMPDNMVKKVHEYLDIKDEK